MPLVISVSSFYSIQIFSHLLQPFETKEIYKYSYEIFHLESDQLKYYCKVDVMLQSILLLAHIGIKSSLEGFVISCRILLLETNHVTYLTRGQLMSRNITKNQVIGCRKEKTLGKILNIFFFCALWYNFILLS